MFQTPNSLSSGSPRSTPSPTLGKVDGLDLNITAKEMRERIGSRKKRDPRKDNRMDFRKKHEIIQTLWSFNAGSDFNRTGEKPIAFKLTLWVIKFNWMCWFQPYVCYTSHYMEHQSFTLLGFERFSMQAVCVCLTYEIVIHV